MREELLFETKRLLVNYLKGMKCEYEQIHPWRESWEFVVLHSLRVEAYVVKLLEMERHSLSQDEIILTRLAAILHDVGRMQSREEHGNRGRRIVEGWLKSHVTFLPPNIDCNRLFDLIEKHSNKDEKDEDYCSRILKDADILDEIGVMSIFMASSWIDRGNPYFFSLLNERVEEKEIGFCDKMYSTLNTESAKKIVLQRKEFINSFCSQLQEEVEGTAEFGKVSLEDYFN
jgi:HD superfamily phosphodiesterase